MLGTAGTRFACSDSGLAWAPEGMEESRLEDLAQSWLRLWGGTWHILTAFAVRAPPSCVSEPFPSSQPHHETWVVFPYLSENPLAVIASFTGKHAPANE